MGLAEENLAGLGDFGGVGDFLRERLGDGVLSLIGECLGDVDNKD